MKNTAAALFLFSLANVPAAFAAAPLNEIVNPKFLGVSLKYAESKIGSPAKYEHTDALGFKRNTYELQKCQIEVGVKDNKVVSVGMYFDPKKGCDVDVSEIVNKPGSKGSKTRFKDYSWRGELHFTSPQMPPCNACGEGPFYATIDGVGAMGMLTVQLQGDYIAPGSKYDEWTQVIRDSGIDTWKLSQSAQNCELRRFDKQGYALLKDTPVTGIAFSYTHRALQPECSGESVHRTRSS